MIACDLGSNTLRAVEIDCETKERVQEFERIVRTAEGIETDGNISEAAQRRVVEAVQACREHFDFSHGYKAVATAALRRAKNGRAVAECIYRETGIRFEIIDGEKEAEYTRLGVENRLQKLGLPSESYVLLDLGGGSSELIVREGARVVSKSFDVGIVTAVEKYGLENLEAALGEICRPVREYARSFGTKPDIFVGSSGTPTTIAAFLQGMDYDHYDYRKINGFRLSLKMMEQALAKLLSLDPAQRVRWVGVGRDDLIIAGVRLLMEMVRSFGFDEIVVIDDGLREGVGLSLCS